MKHQLHVLVIQLLLATHSLFYSLRNLTYCNSRSITSNNNCLQHFNKCFCFDFGIPAVQSLSLKLLTVYFIYFFFSFSSLLLLNNVSCFNGVAHFFPHFKCVCIYEHFLRISRCKNKIFNSLSEKKTITKC